MRLVYKKHFFSSFMILNNVRPVNVITDFHRQNKLIFKKEKAKMNIIVYNQKLVQLQFEYVLAAM